MPGVIKDLRTFSVAVNGIFKQALVGNSGNAIASLFTEVTGGNARELEFPITFGTGPMREWKGSRIVESVKRSSYRMTTKKYEKTLSLPVEDEEDDNLDLYMPAIRTAALQLQNWQAQLEAKVIEANGLAYDDVAFFSASHPENGGLASNYQAGTDPAWYLIDASKPIKPWLWWTRIAPSLRPKTSPDDDNVFWRDELVWGARARGGGGYGLWQYAFKSKQPLTGPNLEAAEQAMRDRADDYGETLDVIPTILLIPRQLRWDARRLLGPKTIDGGADNLYQGEFTTIVSNRLTGA